MRSAERGIKNAVFLTAFGWAGVAATRQGISIVILPKKDKKAVELQLEFAVLRTPNSSLQTLEVSPSVLGKAVKSLKKYFSGERVLFDLPLDLRYSTRFQRAVWKAATEIPFGETRSYAWIAKRIRNPRASRAVGQAVGANPVPIIIP